MSGLAAVCLLLSGSDRKKDRRDERAVTSKKGEQACEHHSLSGMYLCVCVL